MKTLNEVEHIGNDIHICCIVYYGASICYKLSELLLYRETS